MKKLNIKHWRDKNWKIIHANNFTVCWQFWNPKNILDFSSKLKRDGFLFRTLMSKLLRVNFHWVFKKKVFEKLFLDTSIYFKKFHNVQGVQTSFQYKQKQFKPISAVNTTQTMRLKRLNFRLLIYWSSIQTPQALFDQKIHTTEFYFE